MRSSPAVVALVMLAGACNKQAPFEAPAPPEPVYLAAVSPDYEEGVPGQALTNPFVIQVQDSGGRGVAGAKVTWSIVSGSGSLGAPSPTVTGLDGRTTMSFTPLTPRAEVQATIQSQRGRPVDFRTVPHPAAIYDCVLPENACPQSDVESLVFYPDGTFGLRLTRSEWPGVYTRSGSVLSLWFTGTDYMATATIRGDSLNVEYNESAQLSDWWNSTFLLKEGVLPLP